MQQQLPSAHEILSEAVGIYLKKWKTFIKLFFFTRLFYIPAIIVTLLLMVLISVITHQSKLINLSGYSSAAIPFGLFIIFMIVLEANFVISQLFLFNDPEENINFIELQKKSLKNILPFYLLTFVQGMIILGGLLLLIIPGLIFFIEYYFTSFIFLLENKKGEEALALSREMVKGRFWVIVKRLLALHLLFFAINFIPGFIDSSIAKWLFEIATIFIVNPIIFIYSLVLYKKTRESYSPSITEAKPNKIIYWLMPLLAVICIAVVIGIIYLVKTTPFDDMPQDDRNLANQYPTPHVYLSPTPPRTDYWDRNCSFAMINFDSNKIEDTIEGKKIIFFYLDKPGEKISVTCSNKIARPQNSVDNIESIIVNKQTGAVYKNMVAADGTIEDWVIIHHPDKDIEFRISGPHKLLEEKLKLFSFIWG